MNNLSATNDKIQQKQPLKQLITLKSKISVNINDDNQKHKLNTKMDISGLKKGMYYENKEGIFRYLGLQMNQKKLCAIGTYLWPQLNNELQYYVSNIFDEIALNRTNFCKPKDMDHAIKGIYDVEKEVYIKYKYNEWKYKYQHQPQKIMANIPSMSIIPSNIPSNKNMKNIPLPMKRQHNILYQKKVQKISLPMKRKFKEI